MYAPDTIAAIATPPGAGAIGIIRLSGPDAAAIAERLFLPARAEQPAASHLLRRGRLLDDEGDTIDEVLAVCMRAPHSYTGEEVVEIHCHGSPVILRRALARCCQCGARPAEPGEFTKRAFLNGRLDLVQAEAVAEVIMSRTEAAARTGVRHLSGALSSALGDLRERLVQIRARAEAMIDFPEDDLDVTPAMLLADIEEAAASLDALLATYSVGRLLREGIHLTLVGRPNVGKSSLLNRIVGESRAIVTPFPGTTRDVIRESLEVQGIPVVVADTAGLRAQPDAIERLGIERTRQEASRADGVLLVLDRSEPLTDDDRSALAETAGPGAIVVANKSDLPPAWVPAAVTELHRRRVVEISALTGAGLDDLRTAIVDIAGGPALDPHAPVLTLVRHRDALARAREALGIALQSIGAGVPIDVTTVDVQAAVEHIGCITGEVTTEEVLDRIFREFCIGK